MTPPEATSPQSRVPEPPPGRNLLAGKTVLVTAAAGTGIGFATARRCLAEGARVFVSDVHERRLGEAARELTPAAGGSPVPARVCDVTKESDVQALIASVLETFGHIDVLVNNAGLGGSAAVVDMTDEQWLKVMDVTLTSVFRMTRAVLPHMYRRGTGAIVNNASVLGWRAQPLQAHYAAAKAGVMAFTRCAAMEAAEHGVRINAVAPSIAMHAFLNRVTSDELLAELRRREAFGRTAETWEIANAIVFLASDLSSYMTGEVMSVSSQHP
jgi:3-oxoacyl-[acyl-carrier protein] reductase